MNTATEFVFDWLRPEEMADARGVYCLVFPLLRSCIRFLDAKPQRVKTFPLADSAARLFSSARPCLHIATTRKVFAIDFHRPPRLNRMWRVANQSKNKKADNETTTTALLHHTMELDGAHNEKASTS